MRQWCIKINKLMYIQTSIVGGTHNPDFSKIMEKPANFKIFFSPTMDLMRQWCIKINKLMYILKQKARNPYVFHAIVFRKR